MGLPEKSSGSPISLTSSSANRDVVAEKADSDSVYDALLDCAGVFLPYFFPPNLSLVVLLLKKFLIYIPNKITIGSAKMPVVTSTII